MVYKGDKLTYNYAASFKVLINLGEVWQIGADIASSELSRKSTIVYHGIYGNSIGNDNKKLVYAKFATSVTAVINAKANVYNGYLYGGLAAGYSIMRNNSKRLFANESYKAADGGMGPVLGGHLGYTHGLSPTLGFNLQADVRHYRLTYDAEAPLVEPAENIKYNISSLSLTIGLRYRIVSWRVQNDIPPFRGRGRSY